MRCACRHLILHVLSCKWSKVCRGALVFTAMLPRADLVVMHVSCNLAQVLTCCDVQAGDSGHNSAIVSQMFQGTRKKARGSRREHSLSFWHLA